LFVNKTLSVANSYYPITLITYFTTPKNFDIDNLCAPSKKKPPPNGYYLQKEITSQHRFALCTYTQEREECNLWDGSQAAGPFTGHCVWH
jgi:hypothetical protein